MPHVTTYIMSIIWSIYFEAIMANVEEMFLKNAKTKYIKSLK